jgi:hypothetical protein
VHYDPTLLLWELLQRFPPFVTVLSALPCWRSLINFILEETNITKNHSSYSIQHAHLKATKECC